MSNDESENTSEEKKKNDLLEKMVNNGDIIQCYNSILNRQHEFNLNIRYSIEDLDEVRKITIDFRRKQSSTTLQKSLI